MDISIVIPFYKGNDYINRLFNSIEVAINRAKQSGITVEIILINDSPEYDILLPTNTQLVVNTVQHTENFGIHQSRIDGVYKAVGKYILFLDQDDELTEDALVSNYHKILDCDVIIGNGYFDFNQSIRRKIYPSIPYQNQCVKERPYLIVRDLIVSPGQCLIKKASIPEYWLKNPMNSNGADDYLLWLLMFENKSKFISNPDITYIHHDSGENVSFDISVMEKSTRNLLSMLQKNINYPKWKIRLISRTLKYKYHLMNQNKSYFLASSIINIDLFTFNLFFRIKYGGTVVSSEEMRIKNE